MAVQERDDLLVDLSDQDLLDDVHRGRVGDAHAAHEARGDALRLERRVDLRAAAVHDHRAHAVVLEERDVLREGVLQLLVLHRVAAVLDDHHLAREALNVGQRLEEDVGLLDRAHAGVMPGDDGRDNPRITIGETRVRRAAPSAA